MGKSQRVILGPHKLTTLAKTTKADYGPALHHQPELTTGALVREGGGCADIAEISGSLIRVPV